jgi:cytochrome c oxidase subunit 2
VFPEDASLHGHLLDELFKLALALTVPAFVAVLFILVFCLVRYRRREGRPALYTHGDSKKARALTFALAALVFLGIDVNLAWWDHHAFSVLYGSPPPPDRALRVRVLAEQFLWTFRYAGEDGAFDTADDVVTTGELRIPTGRPVVFELRSRDVLHSFAVPSLRLKQDVVPGLTTSAYSEAKVAGRYEVMCAQLCGYGHYAMRARLWIDAPSAFDAWLRERNAEFAAASLR